MPIVPPIKGIENVNVFTVRNVMDIQRLSEKLKNKKLKYICYWRRFYRG